MSMTVVVTRDVADRFSGFLASIMPEVAPGVFTAPYLSKAVRERLWTVLTEWWTHRPGGSILMIVKDEAAPGRLRIFSLGSPVRDLADIDGVLVGKKRQPKARGGCDSTGPEVDPRQAESREANALE